MSDEEEVYIEPHANLAIRDMTENRWSEEDNPVLQAVFWVRSILEEESLVGPSATVGELVEFLDYLNAEGFNTGEILALEKTGVDPFGEGDFTLEEEEANERGLDNRAYGN